MDDLDWASVVRLVRKRHMLKQAALADMLGASQSAVSRWEKGTLEPDTRNKQKILDMYAQPFLSPGWSVLKSQIQHSDCIVLLDRFAIFREISTNLCAYFKHDRSEIIGRSNAEKMIDGGVSMRALCKTLLNDARLIYAKSVSGGYASDGTLSYTKSEYMPIIGPDGDFYIKLITRVVPEIQYNDFNEIYGQSWKVFEAFDGCI